MSRFLPNNKNRGSLIRRGESGHIPVLLEQTIEYLDLEKRKEFVDATLDGGGHTKEIAKRYPDLKIVGIELDSEEIEKFKKENPDVLDRIEIINDSYINLRKIVTKFKVRPDGILFDLGVSSWHFDSSGRGFSFLKDEVLDMRFSPRVQKRTAADVVNTYGAKELERILALYGQEQFAKQIAKHIFKTRTKRPIIKTYDLVEIIEQVVPKWYKHKKINCATKTFQALRIEVNDELNVVRKGIEAAIEVLNPKGRIVVIAFHGLEDKIVRDVFKEEAAKGGIRWVTKRTIRPDWEEVKRNPRSRSAKMKIAEKI
jgi:16S rRNA (cytosine1402-N4)-methyltransferase